MLDPSHHPNWDPSQIPPISDGDLLHNVLLAAKKALLHSKYFKDEYVSRLNLIKYPELPEVNNEDMNCCPLINPIWVRKSRPANIKKQIVISRPFSLLLDQTK